MNDNSTPHFKDDRVPRVLDGSFINDEYEEPIQIEYRYSSQTGFDISTRIQNHGYYLSGQKYFDVMSELLDQLPVSSKIIIRHSVMVYKMNKKEIVELEEHLHPYKIRNSATVVYQVKLFYDGIDYQTHPTTEFGGTGGTRGGALEELRSLIDGKFILGVCYFCQYLVGHNPYGGTDYRHDQLYCFRDTPDVFRELEKRYPQTKELEELLSAGTANVSSLHGCSSFSYQARPRP